MAFSPIEESFFETAQAKTDAEDDESYDCEPGLATRRTDTVQAVARSASRCYAVFR